MKYTKEYMEKRTFDVNSHYDTADNSRIGVVKNSELKHLVFEENGQPVKYQLVKLINIGGTQVLCVIERMDTKETSLVLASSAVELIKKGYIENAIFQGSIRHSKNRLKTLRHIHDYIDEKYLVSDSDVDTLFKHLNDEYTYAIDVDDRDIKVISWLRMEPFKFVYDLNNKLCALYIRDEYNNTELVDINKFKQMSSFQYNKGKFSPRSEHKNFYRTLDYLDIDNESYTELLNNIGPDVVRGFELKDPKMNKEEQDRVYRCQGIENVNMEIIANIDMFNGEKADKSMTGSESRVYYAIPKPEVLGRDTVTALYDASYLMSIRYRINDFVIVDANGLDNVSAKRVLERDYKELSTGKYLETYRDIAEYVKAKVSEELDIARAEVEIQVLNAIKHYNNGTLTDDMIKNIGFMVIDESKFKSDAQAYWETNRMLSLRGKNNDTLKYMRYATIEELAEEFNMADLLNKEPATVKKLVSEKVNKETTIAKVAEASENTKADDDCDTKHVVEDDKTSKYLDVAYLNEACDSLIEVRLIDSDTVCVFLVIKDNRYKLGQTEQTRIDYVTNGINKDNLRKVLKRASLAYSLSFNVEDVLNELV